MCIVYDLQKSVKLNVNLEVVVLTSIYVAYLFVYSNNFPPTYLCLCKTKTIWPVDSTYSM